jgi:hypothetical protein
MALYKTSAITDVISGNVGGQNFVAATRTPYIRTRRGHTIGTTAAQLDARSRWQHYINRWATLTDAQRSAWSLAATFIPTNNRLGLPKKLTGREYYLQYNMFLSTPFGTAAVGIGSNADDPPPYAVMSPPTSITFVHDPGGDIEMTVAGPAPMTIAWPAGDNIRPTITAVLGDPQVNEWIGVRIVLLGVPFARWSQPLHALTQVQFA